VSTTTAETRVPNKWSRERTLMAVLIVSAALNLCFVGGAVWTRLHPPAEPQSMTQHYQQIAAQLDLDPRQRTAFERYFAAMRARSEKMHQQVAPLVGEAWEAVARPEADVKQVLQLIDAATDKRREFQHEAAVQTLDFLSTLSPDQRAKFVAFARERHPRWPQQPQSR
jgi:uncharacterized membrane protein